MEKPLTKTQIEKNAVETLLESGMTFKAGMVTFRVKQSYLGTLMYASKIYLEIALDEEQLKNKALVGTYMNVPENAIRTAKFVAIAILNSPWKIALFTGILSRYLLWTVTPEKLYQLMSMILILNNTTSFTNSIRLMHAFRMMMPKEGLVEA